MSIIMTIAFWALIFIIFYTYFGYTLVVIITSLFIDKPVKKDEQYEPEVTFLITAFNEEKDIARKLDNTRSLEYPQDKMEILVASDGSTDRTDEIVRAYSNKFPNIRLHRVEGRVGKTETQNQAVKTAKGEVIIFSDATTEYHKDAVRKIVRNYADPHVGAVSGRYNYVTLEGSAMGIATVLFWKYENFIKKCQTKIKTITGCCGCIYSVRKDLYVPLRRDIISDLVEPLKILQKGYRIVFEPEAIAYERTTEKSSDEFRMRVRVITRGMNGLLHMKSLMNPLKYGFISFQLISHKVLRWLIPVFMLALFFSNIFLLGKWFYDVAFISQIVFYLFAFLGFITDTSGKKIKIFSIPLYFCIVNIASIASLLNLLKGEKKIIWNTARNP